ncbi:MAG: hypothetical protein PVJ61_05895 [Dehalococcoidia bacterium]
MAKEIILYNLAENVTDAEYLEYVKKEKGPLFDSLASVEKFELVKIVGAAAGEIPYKYVGIVHLKSLEEFRQKDAPSEKFQNFLKKWQPMTSGTQILIGEEIY